MDQERADYDEPPSPRSRVWKVLVAVVVLIGVAAVAAGGWMALLMFGGSCSKYG